MVNLLQYKMPGTRANADPVGEDPPQIVIPILGAMDCFMPTAEGETPPVMGVPMFDSLSKEERKNVVLDTRHTYSFSLHSQCLDLTQWMITNVPGVRPMSLSSFWEDMDIFFVAYFVNSEGKKIYLFKFRVRNLYGKENYIPTTPTSACSPTSAIQNHLHAKTIYPLSVSIPSWTERANIPRRGTAPAFCLLVNDQQLHSEVADGIVTEASHSKKWILLKEYNDVLKLASAFVTMRETCGYTSPVNQELLNLPTRFVSDCTQRSVIESQRIMLENYLNLLCQEPEIGYFLCKCFLRESCPSVTLADPVTIPSSKVMGAHGKSKRRGDPLKEGAALRARWESYWRGKVGLCSSLT